MNTSILLVDDDIEYAELLGVILHQAGIHVTLCHTGKQALQEVASAPFNLILMDVAMPEMDGFSALHQLRRVSDIPVIMLTSRIAAADRVQGLDGGADDYICKPCDPDELLSRIRAVLRRTHRSNYDPVFLFGSHRFESRTRELTHDNRVIRLTSLEAELLSMLLHARGRTVTRESIALALQDRELDAFDRSLDVHISRLRAKLGEDAASIQTIRGIGYSLHATIERM
ncbi:response regulator transcription factor [Silvibacterium dinghuense]|uniref:Response regulator transcription factor n=1 Tax=Silvibacterium dinghuense TaxID=1560006 RepID=A0A4Q1SB88_9BACT|nr:response regulator transcription factor [Silvibacterium dinghuense]RXS94267.1 response regulator transcription factor [Silvibacterium dinghuense]GGH17309.1 DNA-binding response regulator [Silvibacterium dinghuense]